MNVYRISFDNKSKMIIDDEILEPIWAVYIKMDKSSRTMSSLMKILAQKGR